MIRPHPEFREVARSPLARFESGTAVVGGRFHIIGGHVGEDLDVTAEHWAYDPAADRWDRCADQPEPSTHYTCKVQADRYVWYTGGYRGKHPGDAVQSTWRYDAQQDTWDRFADLPELRASLGCAIFGDTMHVWGGLGADRNTNFDDHWSLDLNDPTGWTTATPMPEARGHFGTAVIDGVAYAIGGHFYHDTPDRAEGQSCADLDYVHRYDPAADAWQRMNDLPIRRSHVETATLTYDHHVLILGGRNNCPGTVPAALRGSLAGFAHRVKHKVKQKLDPPTIHNIGQYGLDQITAYDPAADRWEDVGRLPFPLYACAAGIVGDQLIVTNGGKNAWKDPNDQTFVATLAA
jgi:N-acetylneuraminic acid mutarotase